jgi:hypothetical protein
MRYTIIDKIEYIDGIVYTPIGYIDNNPQLVDDVNSLYQNFENWINTNRTDLENGVVDISEFFINLPYVYSANTEVDDIEGYGLIEIKNIDEL